MIPFTIAESGIRSKKAFAFIEFRDEPHLRQTSFQAVRIRPNRVIQWRSGSSDRRCRRVCLEKFSMQRERRPVVLFLRNCHFILRKNIAGATGVRREEFGFQRSIKTECGESSVHAASF